MIYYLNIFILIVGCSIMGFMWAEFYTQPGEIFNKLFNKIDKLSLFLSKPLGGCARCVTGQLALWSFLLFLPYNSCELSLIIKHLYYHILFISTSILITWIILTIKERN